MKQVSLSLGLLGLTFLRAAFPMRRRKMDCPRFKVISVSEGYSDYDELTKSVLDDSGYMEDTTPQYLAELRSLINYSNSNSYRLGNPRLILVVEEKKETLQDMLTKAKVAWDKERAAAALKAKKSREKTLAAKKRKLEALKKELETE
jgi:hypothetical protein